MFDKHPIPPAPLLTTPDGLLRMQRALEEQIALGIGAGGGSLPISVIDLPLADPTEPLLRLLLTDGMTFTVGDGNAGVAATSPSTLRLRQNGAANGTVVFTGTTGVVSFTNPVYAPGDIFELYPPVAVDATLDRVSITLQTT